jgi:thiamine biosynthesis lipoprotein
MDVRLFPFKFIFLFLFSFPVLAQWQQFNYVAMTTPISLVFWEEDTMKARSISSAVFREFDEIEHQMSRYIYESELSFVNRMAFKEPVRVSKSLFGVLSAAMQISRLSDGAFDITFASVGNMYDFRNRLQPNAQSLQAGMSKLNYQHVHLDEVQREVKFEVEGVLLDLGGIAKGYAVDQGIRILRDNGIQSAHLSAGGDMRLLGDKKGKPWIIGIRNPRDQDKQSLVVPLSDTAISTSGDYERFFIDESGERIHHILSPKTGKPAKGLQSVSVLAKDSITSDGLSTAIFVLGLKKGMALVNRLDGIDAIFIDDKGKVHYSEGLMQPGK